MRSSAFVYAELAFHLLIVPAATAGFARLNSPPLPLSVRRTNERHTRLGPRLVERGGIFENQEVASLRAAGSHFSEPWGRITRGPSAIGLHLGGSLEHSSQHHGHGPEVDSYTSIARSNFLRRGRDVRKRGIEVQSMRDGGEFHPARTYLPSYLRCMQVVHANRAAGMSDSPEAGTFSGRLKKQIIVLYKRFIADWKAYCLIPLIAAFIGWFTNWLAVQMIFYPLNFWGIPLYVVDSEPLGFLGWRGIVPAKTAKMSGMMVDMVTTHLLDVDALFKRLQPGKIAELLAPEMNKIVQQVVSEIVPLPSLLQSYVSAFGQGMNILTLGMPGLLKGLVQRAFARGLVRNMQDAVPVILDLKESVVTTMLSNRILLVNLFQLCGKVELRFLVNSGLWVGFALGIIQMFFWLIWQKPWTLTAGGLIVGLLTNWIALKMIFEPVEPLQIGPFVLQGLFQKRRLEVSQDFAECFSNAALTSKCIWHSIFTGPQQEGFANMVQDHVRSMIHKTGVGLMMPASAIATISSKVLEKLPDHVHVLHEYIDQRMDIRGQLKDAMSKMSAQQFERVLHPIFEEDEMTLILVGGFLGGVAGFVQQVLEMQKMGVLPKSWLKWLPFLETKVPASNSASSTVGSAVVDRPAVSSGRAEKADKIEEERKVIKESVPTFKVETADKVDEEKEVKVEAVDKIEEEKEVKVDSRKKATSMREARISDKKKARSMRETRVSNGDNGKQQVAQLPSKQQVAQPPSTPSPAPPAPRIPPAQTIANGKYILAKKPRQSSTNRSMIYRAYLSDAEGKPTGTELAIKVTDEETLVRENRNYDLVTFGPISGRFVNKVDYLTELNANFDIQTASGDLVNQSALVMEAGRGDLKDILQERNFRGLEGRALRDAAKAAAKCVLAMHSHGYVWTDVKTDNFVLFGSEEGATTGSDSDSKVGSDAVSTVKGIDVESAVPLWSDPISYSLDACPPEFMRGLDDEGYDEDFVLQFSFDIWGYGMVLYEIATGRRYFYGKGARQMNRELSSEDFEADVSDVPDEKLRDLIQQCLSSDPKKRPNILQVLRHPYFKDR